MSNRNSKYPCLYCGAQTSKGNKGGEHIVPKVIGGGKTLNECSDKVVCEKCNNGVLSELDKELCSRSYLSMIASQKIAAHLWQAWEVDHSANNLLVEAKPSWDSDETLRNLVSYPQITFERSGMDFRGDSEEIRQFGWEDSVKVLFKAVRKCFERFCAGEKKSIHLERIQSGAIHGYRLTPRIFTCHSISEIARNINKQSFILRFVSEEDKRFALRCLSRLDGRSQQFSKGSHQLGSHFPRISIFFDIEKTLRSLFKIGLNLVAAFCPNTPVNAGGFDFAVKVILGKMPIQPKIKASNGFIHAEDIPPIKNGANSHSFRLVFVDDMWRVYSCFFGGSIGAFVAFPGLNHEGWRCADIVAPLNSKDWTVRTSPILPYANSIRISWNDSRVIIPSLTLQNAFSSVRVELARRK